MRSNHGNRVIDNSADMSFASRCLDASSVSTMGLVHLLSRWAYMAKNHGGLESKGSRSASAAMLQSMLLALVDGTDGIPPFTLQLSKKWVSCRNRNSSLAASRNPMVVIASMVILSNCYNLLQVATYPRPQPYYVASVQLSVLKLGLDVGNLLALEADRSGDKLVVGWCTFFRNTFQLSTGNALIPWASVLKQCIGLPLLSSFVAQLECHIAGQVEVQCSV